MLPDSAEGVFDVKKSDITYILCAVFMAFVNLFYCLTMWLSIRLPRYYPLEHTWKWIKEANVPSQGWYAMQAFAFLSAGIVTLIVYLVLRRRVNSEIPLKPSLIVILAIAANVIVLTCMGYILYHEFSRWGIL